MKRFMVPVVIASLIGGAAFAQTNVVSSVNVVGYNQISMPSNQLVLVALDFSNGTNNTVNGLFGGLPTGAAVTFWNSTSQTWVPLSKSRTGWGTGGTNVLSIGSGAFVLVPFATNIYLSGDVPMTSTTTLSVVTGLKMISYPYPADMPFTNTALAKGAATGDGVSVWNNGWTPYSKSRTGWGTATNIQLKVGQAVLYSSVTNRTVNEVKPYTIN